MSATDSDNSIDWLASDCDDESERESDSGGKTCGQSRESSPARSPSPQPGPADGARRARARDGSPLSCAVTWEPAAGAGLRKRQQGERTNPQHALKRPCDSAEEERKDRPHLPSPPSEADRAFSRKVSASLASSDSCVLSPCTA